MLRKIELARAVARVRRLMPNVREARQECVTLNQSRPHMGVKDSIRIGVALARECAPTLPRPFGRCQSQTRSPMGDMKRPESRREATAGHRSVMGIGQRCAMPISAQQLSRD